MEKPNGRPKWGAFLAIIEKASGGFDVDLVALSVMDTRTARVRAWEWVSNWRWTTSFWIVEVLVGGLVGLLTFFLVEDPNSATLLIGAGVGAIVAFPLAFLIRWAIQYMNDIQELRVAVAAQGVTTPTDAPSELVTYAEQQARRMEELIASIGAAEGQIELRAAWQDFLDVSFRTVRGLTTLRPEVATYLLEDVRTAERRVANMPVNDFVVKQAQSIVDATRDIETLKP